MGERWSTELLHDRFKSKQIDRRATAVSTKTDFSLPFRPFCFKVFAESWMVLPWPMFSGNFRSSRFPSVLSRATSSSVHNREVSVSYEGSGKATRISLTTKLFLYSQFQGPWSICHVKIA